MRGPLCNHQPAAIRPTSVQKSAVPDPDSFLLPAGTNMRNTAIINLVIHVRYDISHSGRDHATIRDSELFHVFNLTLGLKTVYN